MEISFFAPLYTTFPTYYVPSAYYSIEAMQRKAKKKTVAYY